MLCLIHLVTLTRPNARRPSLCVFACSTFLHIGSARIPLRLSEFQCTSCNVVHCSVSTAVKVTTTLGTPRQCFETIPQPDRWSTRKWYQNRIQWENQKRIKANYELCALLTHSRYTFNIAYCSHRLGSMIPLPLCGASDHDRVIGMCTNHVCV